MTELTRKPDIRKNIFNRRKNTISRRVIANVGFLQQCLLLLFLKKNLESDYCPRTPLKVKKSHYSLNNFKVNKVINNLVIIGKLNNVRLLLNWILTLQNFFSLGFFLQKNSSYSLLSIWSLTFNNSNVRFFSFYSLTLQNSIVRFHSLNNLISWGYHSWIHFQN